VMYELKFYTNVGESGSNRKIFFNVVVLAALLIVNVGPCGPLGVL
jgi:hypothetical protein